MSLHKRNGIFFISQHGFRKGFCRMPLSQEAYHRVLKLFPPSPSPAFEEEDQLVRHWGHAWGVNSEIGKLRMILLHRPGIEMKCIKKELWDDEVQAIIAPDKSWYWRDREEPDLDRMVEEHEAYAKVFRDNGVEVVYLDGVDPNRPKAVNVRDVGTAVPGGFIVGRFGPLMRRGEEQRASLSVAKLGMPILRTINGTGIFEGGNFMFIDDKHAAVGFSQRTNEEGIRQLREVLTPMGVELIALPLTGFRLHIDGTFMIVDHHKAIYQPENVPYFFIKKLEELGFELIQIDRRDPANPINCVPLEPGKVIMSTGTDGTAEILDKHGVKVIQVEYSEIQKNGGGLHCSSLPLIRDRIYY